MAALVQTYPQQTGTITMLQTRPTANSAMMAPQTQPTHQFAGASQAPRSTYHAAAAPIYRGNAVPVQPYAFTTTPSLTPAMQWQQPYGTYRTNSSPAVPIAQGHDYIHTHRSSRSMPMNQGYINQMGIGQGGSRDDSAIVQARNIIPAPRPHSAAYLSVAGQAPAAQPTSGKAAPDRYRRPSGQSAQHARSQSSTHAPSLGMAYGQNNSSPTLAARPTSMYAAGTSRSKDDMSLYRQASMEDIQRRQQSLRSNSSSNKSEEQASAAKSRDADGKSLRVVVPMHSRNTSSESVGSSPSSHSRPSSAANRNVSAPTGGNPSLATSDEISGKQDQPRIPSRVSSADASKRMHNPSPLSKPMAMNGSGEDSSAPTAGSHNGNLDSPAAKQLAALNMKGGKGKSKTSRLRRAFSFGSAADFRQAAGEDAADTTPKNDSQRLQKNPTPEEAYDAEQARIAEAQEAAGIGNSIYGSRFFGSTDNLSISSTASSASIMIRKMGRGMKKSTRSLVGLFRPKSVIGVPAAEALAPEASEATVSMITVEAETRRVNVSADPQAGNGGTSFPHLERNSMDASQVPEMVQEGNESANGDGSRKSIVGGDRERAEVLAAVRKGILKRSTSPSKRTTDAAPQLDLPGIPAISDSPNSSAPSTPNDDAQSHRRAGSIAIGNEDYFMSALRLRQDSKSAPGTPSGTTKRNATFSPRIVFHDTWPSQEYDRRGEVATCNRLTPMLAQQIKEELNSFKMEMEVHENSKIYTHFF
jgi:hypothetical protein